jgi:hypothetical protein
VIPATAPEQTVLAGRRYRIFLRVEIEDALGVFLDYSDYVNQDFQYLAEVGIDVDARIAQARIELIRESSGNSLAPLLNSDINVGRGVRIAAARIGSGTPVSGDYKPLFEGSIDEWGHPQVDGEQDSNRLVLVGRDGLGDLMDRWVEVETQYGSEDGIPLETVMQEILDDWGDGVELYVPTATGTNAGPFSQLKSSVADALQSLADLIGWVIEYRWDSVTAAWRVTLYEPDRTPASTQWTFGPNDYKSVNQLSLARYHIRNAVRVGYTLASTGVRAEYIAEDPTSIAKYGRRWMEIEEGDAALSDLSEPSADQEITAPLFWPVQLGDFYEFLANAVHYDVDQEFAVTGYTHVLQNGEGETRLRTRGKPVGSVRGWLRREHKQRPADEVAAGRGIQDFRLVGETPEAATYAWRLGSDLEASWIHDFQRPFPVSDDHWPGSERPPEDIDDTREMVYVVARPPSGSLGYLQVEGRLTDGSIGDMQRALIYPPDMPPDFIAFASAIVNQANGSVKITGWTGERARAVTYAYNVGPASSVSAPTVADAEAQGGSADGGGIVTGFTSDFEITLPAGTVEFGEVIKGILVAYTNANGTGGDGTAQDHGQPVGFQGERFKITDPDQIDVGVVIAEKLTKNAQSFNMTVEFSATDWDTVAWTGGTLDFADGSSFAISGGNTGNLANDAPHYVYFDPAISTTVLQVTAVPGNTVSEDAVVLAVVKRAGASNQSAFFVPAVGVFGINETVIGPNSISTGKVQASAITTATLAAGAVTAAKIDVAYLRAIAADLGIIIAGYISNSDNTAAIKFSGTTADPDGIPALPATNYIDFTATGNDPFLKHDALELQADGDAIFSGIVAATSFTGASALFEGYIEVRDQNLASAGSKLEQNKLTLAGPVLTSRIEHDLATDDLEIAAPVTAYVFIQSALKYGTHTAIGAETLSGYIFITDAGGTLRKLAVVS